MLASWVLFPARRRWYFSQVSFFLVAPIGPQVIVALGWSNSKGDVFSIVYSVVVLFHGTMRSLLLCSATSTMVCTVPVQVPPVPVVVQVPSCWVALSGLA